MASLFPRFERVELVYKIIDNTPFECSILVPKSILSTERPCPLLVHFHGGALVMGTRLEPFFLSKWVLLLAEAECAIVVSPAYRLLPEATGADILTDIHDFWFWVRSTLPSAVAARWPGLTLDLARTAATGESAGGYLALQSAFHFQAEAQLRVVMAQYPAMYPDVLDEHLAEVGDKQGIPKPEADKVVSEYLAGIKPGAIRLASPYPELRDLAFALRSAGKQHELMKDERLTLGHSLRIAKEVPPLWIAQGTDDTIIPALATDDMVARVRKELPELPLLYSIQPGEHGFDTDHSLDEPWLIEATGFIRKYWP